MAPESAAPKAGEYLDGKLWFERKLNIVTLGVTNAAIEEIGQVQRVEFPSDGDDFDKGEVIATLDGSSGRLEILAPAAGVVQDINQSAAKEPDMISEDPLEEGWLVKIEIQDSTDLKDLL